jgi:hypothetical protein
MLFEEYCFKKEVQEFSVELAEEGEDGTFLREWLDYRYPELAQKMRLMEAVPMVGAGYRIKGGPVGAGYVEPGQSTEAPDDTPADVIAQDTAARDASPQLDLAVQNLDKITGFFNNLKALLDKEYEDAITRGDAFHKWGELHGSDAEMQSYIQENIKELSEYFGTDDPDVIAKKAPGLARRNNVLTRAQQKDANMQKFVPVLRGLLHAYDKAARQRKAGKHQTGMESHYNGLKGAVDRLMQDVTHFRELFHAHKEGWRVPAKAFVKLKTKYDQPRHTAPEYSTRRI